MEKANIHTPPNHVCPLPWLHIGVVACLRLHAHLSLSAYASALMYRHPFVGQACKRIKTAAEQGTRQGRDFICRSASHRSTSTIPESIHSFTPGKMDRVYDSEADDDDSDDRHCSITGRLMFCPSTQPLCVDVTLNYLVVFQVQGMYPALVERKFLL